MNITKVEGFALITIDALVRATPSPTTERFSEEEERGKFIRFVDSELLTYDLVEITDSVSLTIQKSWTCTKNGQWRMGNGIVNGERTEMSWIVRC
jgi:hypothetical protein